jgi:hypothetical protein
MSFRNATPAGGDEMTQMSEARAIEGQQCHSWPIAQVHLGSNAKRNAGLFRGQMPADRASDRRFIRNGQRCEP